MTENMRSELPLDPDDFAAYYSFAPAALALRECVRLQAVREVDLPEPILDVGCGDGLFASLAYPGRQTWGIDINPSEVRRAQATSAYETLICGNIVKVDLPRAYFSSAIANCSLEHVPDIDGALANICRSLKPRARFVLIVPTPGWTQWLAIPRLLGRVGLASAAKAYGDGLDRVFAHAHIYDEQGWTERLERAGFERVTSSPLVAPNTSWAFDLMLYPSLVGYFTKKLTGRWVIAPKLRSLSVDLARKVVDTLGAVAPRDGGSGETMFVCYAREAP